MAEMHHVTVIHLTVGKKRMAHVASCYICANLKRMLHFPTSAVGAQKDLVRGFVVH